MTNTKTSRALLALRIFLYMGCFVFGAYASTQLDSGWAADKGTAEYMRYSFCFNAVWFCIWSTLVTGAMTLIVMLGRRIAHNWEDLPEPRSEEALIPWRQRYHKRMAKWEEAVLFFRSFFACFAFAALGAVLIGIALSAAAPAAPSTGICLLLVVLYFASKKD